MLKPILLFANRIYLRVIKAFGYISGKNLNGFPTEENITNSQPDNDKQSEKHLSWFKEFAYLQPSCAVLEVGCGTGRTAFQLTRYINDKGSYHGFDTDKSSIDHCNKLIAHLYPNFKFQFTGTVNQLNNTSEKVNSCSFNFPYPDKKFDLAFATSVFTLMLPTELVQYIHEISRVMKPGAYCMISMFIINCESEDLMIKKPTQTNFPYNKGFYRLQSATESNTKIAYDEEWLLEKLEHAGLKMQHIKYGNWCGRKSYFDYEDLIICSKVN